MIFSHIFDRFQCGRWLAKNLDDGSTERLLVAELLNVKRVSDRKPSSSKCVIYI